MMNSRVKDLMKKDPYIISGERTLKEAAEKMKSIDCGALPVGTPDKLEGVITDRDIVIRAVAKGKDVNKALVKDYMTSDVHKISEDETPDAAAALMKQKEINRIVVEDDEGRPSGILTFGRILRKNGSMEEITAVIESAIGRKAA